MNTRRIIKPYHSRAFGSQYGVFSLGYLSDKGLEDATCIYGEKDGVPPARVSRFDTRDEAERYVHSVSERL